MLKKNQIGIASGFGRPRTGLCIVVFAFSAVSCSDGVLDSGADMGSPIVNDSDEPIPTETIEAVPTDDTGPFDTTPFDTTPDDTNPDDTTPDDTASDDTEKQPICGWPGFPIPNLDICWNVSIPFQSCTELCETHGGVHPGVPAYLGAASEGGTLEHCNGLLYVVRFIGYANVVSSVDSPGLGCYHNYSVNANYWVSDVPFDPDAKAYGTQRICGCIE